MISKHQTQKLINSTIQCMRTTERPPTQSRCQRFFVHHPAVSSQIVAEIHCQCRPVTWTTHHHSWSRAVLFNEITVRCKIKQYGIVHILLCGAFHTHHVIHEGRVRMKFLKDLLIDRRLYLCMPTRIFTLIIYHVRFSFYKFVITFL